MYTVLSHVPDVVGARIEIHSHCESKEQAELDRHNAYTAFMKNNHGSLLTLLSPDDTQWKHNKDGLFATINNDKIVVWEKYTKSGRVYGSTSKRRAVQEFDIVFFDGTVTKAKTGRATADGKRADDKTVSYGHVMEELKAKLANGAAAAPPKKRKNPIRRTTVWGVNPLWAAPLTNNDNEGVVDDIMSRFDDPFSSGAMFIPTTSWAELCAPDDATQWLEYYQTAVNSWKDQVTL